MTGMEVNTMNNRLYRICTEYRSASITRIKGLVGEHGFKGATFLQGVGLWEGNEEDSLIIEIVARDSQAVSIGSLAAAIKKINHQEAVLIQSVPITSLLV